MQKFNLKKLLGGLLLTATLLAPFSASAITIPEGRATLGNLTISGSRTEDSVKSNITVLASIGANTVTVSSATGFVAGDYVFLYQAQGTGAGNYQIDKIASISSNTLTLFDKLTSAFQATKAEVIKINEYHDVTVASGGAWSASSWNGTTGGILVALLNGTLTVQTGGSVSMNSTGFGGGGGAGQDCGGGFPTGLVTQGDSSIGTGANSASRNGMGGGAGSYQFSSYHNGGGGGGYGTSGSTAGAPTEGGTTGGSADMSTIFFGGGGGGSQEIGGCISGGGGGTAGGIVFISSIFKTFTGGTLSSNGANGGIGSRFPFADGQDGAGASGGAIYLPTKLTVALGTGVVTATGGTVGLGNAGVGGVGRVATLASATVTGTASPTVDVSSTDTIINKDNNGAIFSAF